MDESIRRKNIEKFRVYTENRFNTLGETNKGMIDRNFDRIMAFYVTQSLAKAQTTSSTDEMRHPEKLRYSSSDT